MLLKFILILCLLITGGEVYTQQSVFLPALSRNASILLTAPSRVDTRMMSEVNHDSLSRDDAATLNDSRVAVGKAVDISIRTAGTIDTLPDGSIVWRIRIVSPGAVSHAFLFENFQLPDYVRLYCYPEGDSVYSHQAYTKANNKRNGQFMIGSKRGSVHILELNIPSGITFDFPFRLSRIYQGYKRITDIPPPPPALTGKKTSSSLQRNFNGSGEAPCSPNVNCPQGDDACLAKYAVCLIERPSQNLNICTATLLNNVNQDFTPYVQTAWHCINSDRSDIYPTDCELGESEIQRIENAVFTFRWWANPKVNCFDNGTEAEAEANIVGYSFQGADFLAEHREADGALMQISSEFTTTGKGFYFAGWDRANTAPPSSFCAHHPAGTIMKIAKASAVANDTEGIGHRCSDDTIRNTNAVSSNYWRVIWTTGATENISSGAALFNPVGRVVGVLSNNAQNFCNSNKPQHADFGKFGVNWTGGGTSDTRYSNWLDPLGRDPQFIDGISTFGKVHLFNRELNDGGDMSSYFEIVNSTTGYYHIKSAGGLVIGGGSGWNTPPPDAAGNNVWFTEEGIVNSLLSSPQRIAVRCSTRLKAKDAGMITRLSIGSVCPTAVNDANNRIMYITEGDPQWQSNTCNTAYGLRQRANDGTSQSTMDGTYNLGKYAIPDMRLPTAENPLTCLLVPNPASSAVQCIIHSMVTGTADIEIYSSIGAISRPALKTDLRRGKNTVGIDVSELANGTYYCVIRSSSELRTIPFMVMR
ncbi:MAG: T9SS type A sorting domain-containing protein [Candidatus Kapabacteria bacterium]|nr:T9SS type A sorting domain-containing protein [Candidatus Kapabacteria bacterium]